MSSNNRPKKTNLIYFIVIIFIAIVLAAVVFLVYNFITPSNRINIKTSAGNQLSQVPKKVQDDLAGSLFLTVKERIANNNDIPKDAEIRPDTTYYYQLGGSSSGYGNFIVDLPSIRQSYLITFSWFPDNPDTITGSNLYSVTCVPPNYVIYNDFQCQDSQDTLNAKVLFYLPYAITLSNGRTMSIDAIYNDSQLEIRVFSPICDDASRKDLVENALSEWFFTRKLDLSQYQYNIIDICNSSNSGL